MIRAVLLACLLVAEEVRAQGLSATSPLLHPGFVDLQTQIDSEVQWTNLAIWTPVFRGGAGRLDLEHAPPLDYAGGYLDVLAAKPDAGALLLASQTQVQSGDTSWEAQGEYRTPDGKVVPGSIGAGGGKVVFGPKGPELWFAKLSYRNELQNGWGLVGSVQLQRVVGDTSPGGYLALYGPRGMVGGGADGEQWRAAVGYIHNVTPDNRFRPAFEAFYVDDSVAKIDGGKFLLVSASLGYGGFGFLSNESRLGRVMGPQGLQFTNPNGFLQPMWNRLFDVTELGNLLNARVTETRSPGDEIVARDWQAVVFPFQVAEVGGFTNWLFVGGGLLEVTDQDGEPYISFGAIGQPGGLRARVEGQWDFDNDRLRVLLTLQDFF